MYNRDSNYFFTGFSGLFDAQRPPFKQRDGRADIFVAAVEDVIMSEAHPKYTSEASIGMVSYRPLKTTQIKLHNEDFSIKWAIPHSKNVKQYPLIGETILVLNGPSPWSFLMPEHSFAYYITTFAIFGSVNANLIPTIQPTLPNNKNFAYRLNNGLKPYEGDYIIEGRNGGSLRFSAASEVGSNFWSGGGVDNNSIVILNAAKTTSEDLRVETFDNGPILVLASNQLIDYQISAVKNGKVLLQSWQSTELAADPIYNSAPKLIEPETNYEWQ